ncbi:MAG: STAS domain-containing protein [Actinomycetota bacterium]
MQTAEDTYYLRVANTHTIVLQPHGSLAGVSALDFQTQIEQALEVTVSGVIVDLQKVDSVAPEGISVLMAGLELAAILGKALAFQSVDLTTRLALRAEWTRSRQISFGPWGDFFEQDFETFLG